MRLCLDPVTREWVAPEEYAARKAARRTPPARGEFPTPYTAGDLPEYVSPVTGKPVDGRRARREDLARNDCREVDPSEFRVEYQNRAWAAKKGLIRPEEVK